MADTKTKSVGGEDSPLPVLDSCAVDANMLIEGNRLAWARIDTGYAVNSTYALANPANVRILGRCDEHTDNTTANAAAFNNSGLAGGARVRYARGIFLLTGDGTVTRAHLGMPVVLSADATGLVTISLSTFASGVAKPLVGYVTTDPRGSTDNPDASKIPVEIVGAGKTIFAGATQDYIVDPTAAYTGAFNTVVGCVHRINPSGATFAYTFPAISAQNNGMKIAVVNVSTGSTGTVAAPTGSDNIGNSAGTSTGATAAGPTGGATKVYVADNTVKAWLVGI